MSWYYKLQTSKALLKGNLGESQMSAWSFELDT